MAISMLPDGRPVGLGSFTGFNRNSAGGNSAKTRIRATITGERALSEKLL
jgi:hypothetical protein